MNGPLDGIKVVDLSLLLPGPLCSMHLGDMGADVIKVENPRAADMTRYMGARLGAEDGDIHNGESGMYLAINRNKRAITVNIKRPEGIAVIHKLLEDADILLEGFRPGALAKMGLGYEDLKEKYPRLIVCAISGYGAGGPYESLAGHDGNYISYSGLLGITGTAGGAPVLPGFQVADIGGGSQAALVSILAALYNREKTGRGQFLDISMMDGAFAFLSLHAGEYVASGKSPERGEMALSGGLPNYNVYRCKDNQYVMLGALEERFFKSFLRRIDKESLLTEHGFSPDGLAKIKPELEKIFAEKTRDEWAELFMDPDTCLAPVNSIEEAFEDPQLTERKMVLKMEHPELGEIMMIGSPFKFSETPCTYRRLPPGHGEHTESILAELGYNPEQIKELRSKRAV